MREEIGETVEDKPFWLEVPESEPLSFWIYTVGKAPWWRLPGAFLALQKYGSRGPVIAGDGRLWLRVFFTREAAKAYAVSDADWDGNPTRVLSLKDLAGFAVRNRCCGVGVIDRVDGRWEIVRMYAFEVGGEFLG